MGGRGSLGGGGSSGGSKGSGGSALSAKMPQLTGSQKQVSWAETIRHDALASADYLVKDARSKFGLSMPAGGRVSVESAEEVRRDIVNAFQQVSSASAIIDRRFAFSYLTIKKAMFAAEMQRRKK